MTRNSTHASKSTVVEAENYLKGTALTPQKTLELVKRLKKEDRFGLARRVLAKVRATKPSDVSLGTRFTQEHALCTFKDPDLPVLQALDQALAILRGSYDLEVTSDQETLGLAGSIHKRRWQATGQKDQLELSYHYYRRGCDVGPSKDNGYTAINAAFVLDQLTDLEATDCAPAINDRRAEAKRIREALVEPRNPSGFQSQFCWF